MRMTDGRLRRPDFQPCDLLFQCHDLITKLSPMVESDKWVMPWFADDKSRLQLGDGEHVVVTGDRDQSHHAISCAVFPVCEGLTGPAGRLASAGMPKELPNNAGSRAGPGNQETSSITGPPGPKGTAYEFGFASTV